MAEAKSGELATPSKDGMGADNMSAMALEIELLRRSTAADEAGMAQAEPAEEATEGEVADEAAEPDVEQSAEQDESEAEGESEQEDQEQQPADDEPDKDESSLTVPAKVQEKIDKRIGKEVARRKAVEEKLTGLQSEVQRLQAELTKIQSHPQQQADTVPVADDGPMAKVTSADGLREAREKARQIKRWAEEVLDSEVDDIRVGEREMTRAEVRKVLREAQRDLEEHIPAREAYLARKEAAESEAKKVFSWLNDTSSQEYQLAMAEMKRRPHLARDPDALWMTGLAIEGLRALKEKAAAAEKAKEKPKAAPKPPPVDPEPKVVPAKKSPASDQRYIERRKQVTETNASLEDIENLLLQNELRRRNKNG